MSSDIGGQPGPPHRTLSDGEDRENCGPLLSLAQKPLTAGVLESLKLAMQIEL